MKLSLINVLFFISLSSYSQNFNGIVLDKHTNEPIVGAHVYLKNKKQGVSTNNKGEYYFQAESNFNEKDSIYFSCVGYITKKISFPELKEKKFAVFLTMDVQSLKEVTIVSGNHLKPKIDFKSMAALKDGLHSFGSLLLKDKVYVIGGDLSFEEDKAKEVLFEFAQAPTSKGLIEQLESMAPEFSWQEFSGSLQIYDINTEIWETSDFEFRKRAYHNVHLHNDNIYILGGKILSANKVYEYLDDKIEVYDIMRDTIMIDHTNPHQGVNFASFVYGDNIIVLGGSTKLKIDGQKEYSNKVHLYNLKSGYWYELKDMPKAKETKGVLIKNKIYLIGGFNQVPLTEIETYDLNTAEWSIEGELIRGLERPAITYHENIIYIFEDGKLCTYNVETKELNEYLIDLNLKSSELFFINNSLYILGGYIEDDFSVKPSSGFYCVDIIEFEKTKIYNSKML